ncbi:MAG TPA: hypothetical protein VG870_08425 [Chitinophagaceae bacterium]|nr:hypothetical protein [Chitinophagaceae bacterium]
MEDDLLLSGINQDFSLALPREITAQDLLDRLAAAVNDLINRDFSRLVGILYRIDVDESRLKSLLKEHPGEDAGRIIAALILEREKQKIQTRQQFQRDTRQDGGEETW